MGDETQINPWDKHLKSTTETSFIIHGLEFVITDDIEAAYENTDSRAVFSTSEIHRLKLAAGGQKLPQELSEVLHRVKSILGGKIVDCSVVI